MKLRSGLVCVIVAIFAFASRHFVVDDGLIYARFMHNALTGQGLVFNPGESVNGLTSPLFTNLLLGCSWLLGGNILLAEHLLYAVCLIGACIAAERFAPWAGVAIASTLYFYSMIGLETSLFLLLILLTVSLYVDARYDWLPLLLTLTLLTRFEGGLLAVIIGYWMWRERRFPRLVSVLPAIAILTAYLILNHHWYGSFLPNSATSKFGQAHSGYWGRWPTGFIRVWGWALMGTRPIFAYTVYLVPLVLCFGYKGWRRLRNSRWSQVFVPFVVALLSFYVLTNMPSYHWYYAPFIFIAFLYAFEGLPKTRTARVALAVVLLVAGTTNLFLFRAWGPDWDYVNVSNWIDANTPPAATVETVELGQIGWYTHRHVIDILGLTFPKNADHIAHRDLTSWLREDQPDYIVVHHPLWPFEQAVLTDPRYQPVPYHSGNVYIFERMESIPSPR